MFLTQDLNYLLMEQAFFKLIIETTMEYLLRLPCLNLLISFICVINSKYCYTLVEGGWEEWSIMPASWSWHHMLSTIIIAFKLFNQLMSAHLLCLLTINTYRV